MSKKRIQKKKALSLVENHSHEEMPSNKKAGLAKSLRATLATRSLDGSLNLLKETISELTAHHAKDISERLIDGFAATIGRVNARVTHLNEWAQNRLHDHHRAKSEAHELELQKSAMDGEGNMPGIAS